MVKKIYIKTNDEATKILVDEDFVSFIPIGKTKIVSKGVLIGKIYGQDVIATKKIYKWICDLQRFFDTFIKITKEINIYDKRWWEFWK